MLGLHSETVPLAWPRDSTALCGFCRMTSQVPSRVLCCATICPVLVSCINERRLRLDYSVQLIALQSGSGHEAMDGQLRLQQPHGAQSDNTTQVGRCRQASPC